MMFIDPSLFDEFNNITVSITRSGGSSGKDSFGNPKPNAPITVLPEQGAQEWPLSESDKEGLSGEQIAKRKKIRLSAYHDNLTEKMTAIVDGAPHNIVAVSDDGSKSVSILTVERITPQTSQSS